MGRMLIGKQVETSPTGGSVVVTDITSGEQKYLAQGTTGQVLTANTVTGPGWTTVGSSTFYDVTSTTTAVALTGNLLTVAGQAMTIDIDEYVGATTLAVGTAGLVNPAGIAEDKHNYRGDGTWELIGSDYKALWQLQPFQGVFVGEVAGVYNSPDLYNESYTNTNDYPVLVQLIATIEMQIIYTTSAAAYVANFDARILQYTVGTTNTWGGNNFEILNIDEDGKLVQANESLTRKYKQVGVSNCIVLPGATCTFTAQMNLNGGPGLFNSQAQATSGGFVITRLRSATSII